MQIGAIFPQTEIGPDPAAVRDYAQAAEAMQFDYLFIADHVLGADPAHHAHVRGPLLHAPQRHSRAADHPGVYRRRHHAHPAGDGYPDSAPTPDGPGGQAGRRD